jgi:hypothetical protein
MSYNLRRRTKLFPTADPSDGEFRVRPMPRDATLETVKRGPVNKRIKLKPVLVDDLPQGALPTRKDLKRLNRLADRVAAGKAKIRYLGV